MTEVTPYARQYLDHPTVVIKTIEMETIPVIDISKLKGGASAEELKPTLKLIRESLSELGFFYVSGHGISEELQSELISLSQKFFAEDLDFKMKIDMKSGGLAWRGYFPPGGELTSGRPDRKEGIYFGRELSAEHPAVKVKTALHGPNQWPSKSEYSRFKELTLKYMSELTELGHLLMEGIALSLGLNRKYFRERFTEDPTILFRIFNYQKHVWSEGDDEWGVREHTDYGFLTLLRQDESGGLQVKSRTSSWIEAPPIKNTFVVNIGDMLEVWTHGIYKATPHRVKNQGKTDRISLPFFFDPGWTSKLQPIDRNLLPAELLSRVATEKSERWDSLSLMNLPKNLTYGEFLWEKVKKVFPQLA